MYIFRSILFVFFIRIISAQETIIVEAEKYSKDQQDVSISITVRNDEFLKEHAIENIKELFYYVPNYIIKDTTSKRHTFPYMRGIGNGLSDPAVSTIIDGIPQLCNHTADIELINIQQIEFLRGPQGTLYGRNTMGGVVIIESKAPSQEWNSYIKTAFGSYDYFRQSLGSSGPLSENLFISLNATHYSRDGYVKNTVTGNDIDHEETIYGRLKLDYFTESNWHMQFTMSAQDDKEGDLTFYDLASLESEPYELAHDFEGSYERQLLSPGFSLQHAGDSIDTTIISSYLKWTGENIGDIDFTPATIAERKNEISQEYFYQELRFNSSEGSDLTLGDTVNMHWLLGTSYFYSHLVRDFSTEIFVGSPGIELAKYDLDDYAIGLFGQATFKFNDEWEIITGLRYEYEYKKIDLDLSSTAGGTLVDSISEGYSQILPRLVLNHYANDDFMTYASIAKGYRSGGFNRNTTPLGQYVYDEEINWAYELGFKSSHLDNRLIYNMAIFHIDISDKQVEVPISGAPGRYYLDNAADAQNQGVEFDLNYKITESYSLFAGLGYVNAEFKKYTDPISAKDVAGYNTPFSPDYNAFFGLKYEQKLNETNSLYIITDIVFFGKSYFDNANTVEMDPYSLVNFKTGISLGQFSIEAWAKNILDEAYINIAIPGLAGYAGISGTPFTYGAALSWRF